MTLTDLKWLSEIFSDTKHRVVSLRQLSFLLHKSSPVCLINVKHCQATSGPQTKPIDGPWVRQYAAGVYTHNCHLLLDITQPKSWYSFYRSGKGRRLSRPWSHTEVVYLPADSNPYTNRPIVDQLHWSRSTWLVYVVPGTGNCVHRGQLSQTTTPSGSVHKMCQLSFNGK